MVGLDLLFRATATCSSSPRRNSLYAASLAAIKNKTPMERPPLTRGIAHSDFISSLSSPRR
jgi:hypothetical protein